MDLYIKLSVHQIVDFLLRKGDIDDRIFNKDTMQEGTKIHSSYQRKQDKNYLSEYFLAATFDIDKYHIRVEGRADGIINEDIPIIDEIKSTTANISSFYEQNKEWHLAQAIFYAYMFLSEKNINKCAIRLTYISQIDDSKEIHDFSFTFDEVKDKVFSLLNEYIKFLDMIEEFKRVRNQSCEKLMFPFKEFRLGQQKLSKYTYSIAKNGGLLFVEAPTGIGKTVSTLYPFVKSFKDGVNEKIFYLTAKTSGRQAAFETCQILKDNGLDARDIIITAKEKICFCKNATGCNPDNCPYAKGYYDKISGIIIDSLNKYKTFDETLVQEIANKNSMCPFELQLDLSLYCDIIICDYNYLFDPIVYMQRYFDNDSSKFLVLVDEAHNLVDRGRDMYSISLRRNDFVILRKSLAKAPAIKQIKKVKNGIKRMINLFNRYDTNEEILMLDDLTHKDDLDINYMQQAFKEAKTIKDDFRLNKSYMSELSRDLNRFIRLYEMKEDYDFIYINKDDEDISLNLKAIDVKKRLRNSLTSVKGAVVFSATLSPIDYFVDVIGGESFDPVLKLRSPFKKENLDVLVAPNLSIKYKNRDKTYKQVSEYIKTFVKGKVGNYLIYVPSFEYLDNISSYLEDSEFNLVKQERDFDDLKKLEFLSFFPSNPINTTVGLAVIGGSFSEGIDLIDDRLIGVVIVGVGLPQICFERDLIKDYYNKDDSKKGFDYSYVNPGINRILQAAGRVIRSENDKGAILLIDDRYLSRKYIDLFSSHWSQYKVVFSNEEIKKNLKIFWNK